MVWPAASSLVLISSVSILPKDSLYTSLLSLSTKRTFKSLVSEEAISAAEAKGWTII